MKLSKTMKRVLAYVCAITLVVSSITVANTAGTLAAAGDAVALAWTSTSDNAGAATFTDTSDDSSIGYKIEGFTTDYSWNSDSKWQGQAQAKGISVDTSKYYKLVMNMEASANKNIVVQLANDSYSFLLEETINTSEGTYEVIFQPTAAKINLTLAFGATSAAEAGTYNITLSGITLTETEETTTEEVTTEPVADEDGYTAIQKNGTVTIGDWTLYSASGGWGAGYMSYKGTTNDDIALKINNQGSYVGSWELQAKRANASVYTGLTSGTTYNITATFSSTAAGQVLYKLEGINDGTTYDVVTGTNTITEEFTYTSIPGGYIVFELSGMPANSVISNIGFSIAAAEGEEVTTATGSEEVTTATGETTWTTVEASDNVFSYANANNISVVNVQKPGFAAEKGIYMTTSAGIGYIKINGIQVGDEAAAIQGAGAVVYLSALTSAVSTVEYCGADGSVIGSIDIKNANATSVEETTTGEATTEPITTEGITIEEVTTEPTTTEEAPAEPTTAEQDATTVAPTTAEQDATTVAPTTATKENVTKPARVKIKKVNAKKKSAKTVKISLKKTKGAVGYQIAIYKAKKNKKALVKKIVNKRKVTIKSKKLKNKSKLFVKVRAYVLDPDGKKLYGKWSKVKKVKIK